MMMFSLFILEALVNHLLLQNYLRGFAQLVDRLLFYLPLLLVQLFFFQPA